jgi:hypothetical protein
MDLSQIIEAMRVEMARLNAEYARIQELVAPIIAEREVLGLQAHELNAAANAKTDEINAIYEAEGYAKIAKERGVLANSIMELKQQLPQGE